MKKNNQDNWYAWYKAEVMDRIKDGQSHEEIRKELNITHVDKFINNEK